MAQELADTLIQEAYRRIAAGQAEPGDGLIIVIDRCHKEDQADHKAILELLGANGNPGLQRPRGIRGRAKEAAPPVLSGAGLTVILLALLEKFFG